MSVWESTPFNSLEGAHLTVLKMGGTPSAIVEREGMRSFQVSEGRDTYLVAQAVTGGPVKEKKLPRRGRRPALQDPDAPTFSDTQRLLVSQWTLTEYESLEDVEAHYAEQFVNPDNLEVLTVRLYRIDDDEYEYAEDAQGVWARALTKRK